MDTAVEAAVILLRTWLKSSSYNLNEVRIPVFAHQIQQYIQASLVSWPNREFEIHEIIHINKQRCQWF